MSSSLFSFSKSKGRSSFTAPFPDPFADYASLVMPDTMYDALDWSEAIISVNGIYRAALERVIGFFITEVKIDGASPDERERYEDFLNNTLGINAILRQVALDFLTYGNSFTSLIVPFDRYVRCEGCGFDAPLQVVAKNPRFNYKWSGMRFHAHCPYCEYQGPWTHVDRRSGKEDAIQVRRWNPKEIELLFDPYSHHVDYVWKIPGGYRAELRQGELHTVQRVPWEIVKSVQSSANLLFESGVIYHMKEDTLAGIQNRGWGISRVLSNFRQAWYVQVLHRFNEAIGMDYIIPMRVICPDNKAGSTGEYVDPAYGMDLGGFAGHVSSMLSHRRQDPMAWHVCPYPLKYQFMGAEANAMAPHELIDQSIDNLLNAVGVPVQFYKADLTLQGAQPALRLMESTWSHLTYALNRFLHWLIKKVSEVMSWEEVTAKLERPSVADDINRQLARLQLMTGGLISQTTGLKSIGLDYREEQRKMLADQSFLAQETQKLQGEMQAKLLAQDMAQPVLPAAPPGPAGAAGPGAAAPPGGAAPAAGGAAPVPGMPVDPVEEALAMLPMDGQPIDPVELRNNAETIAQKAFGLPHSQKSSLLRRLKQRNEAVYVYVKSKLEEMDTGAKQRGLDMARQAAQTSQAQQVSLPMA